MGKELFGWLSIGSTYTYLTALRLKSVLSHADVAMTVRPFSVRQIMLDMDNVPFPPSKPEKQAYMWRDIQRQAQKYNLPIPQLPVSYPLKDYDLANLVGVVAVQQGWYLDYLETTYRLWFVAGLAAGSGQNLQQICAALGQDYGALLSQAQAPNTYKDYQHNTALARRVSVFGA